MAITAEQLNVILSARDREFARAMERNAKRVERFEQRSRKSLTGAGRSFDAIGRAARALGPILAAAFSLSAITNLTRGAAEIGRLAMVAGTSVEEFQRFAAGARFVGIEMGKASDIIKDVNDKVGDFLATGGGPMADFFENIAPQVGVTADQFARLSGPAALELYVKSLEAANLSQAEMTFYMEAIANDATALLPVLRDNAAEMRRLGDEAQDAGRILDGDAVDAARDLEREAGELSDTIRTALTTAILDNKEELMAVVDFITEKAIPAFASLITALGEAAELYDFIRNRNLPEGANPGAGFLPPGANVPGTTPMTAEEALRLYGTGYPGAPTVPPAPANPLFKGYVPGDDITNTPEGRRILGLDGGGNGSGGGGGSSRAVEDVDRLRDSYRDLIGTLDRAVAINNDYEDAQDLLNRALKSGAINGTEFNIGMEAAQAQMQKAQFEASALGEAMQDIESSMESAFMSIRGGTESAKEAFRSMAKEVIAELYRVLVVQQLVGQFEQGGGGILGAVFGAFGGSLTGKASGGGVQGNRPYMVGESGREMFVPSSAGRIMSAPQTERILSGGGGGMTINQSFTFTGGVTERDLGRMIPLIVEESKRAVVEAAGQGGAFAQKLRGS